MDDKTIQELKKPLDPKMVKVRPDNKMSYIEGWQAEAIANEIFNFQWDSEVLELIENTSPTQNQKGNYVVSFRAKVRITAAGRISEGVGFGSGISKDIHSAYEGAIKEAETDAEKRALKKFGHRFGLALYDKDQKNVKDIDVYDMEINRADFLTDEIKKYLTDNKSEIGKAWATKAVDSTFVKRVNRDKYNEILAHYTLLKKEGLSDNS